MCFISGQFFSFFLYCRLLRSFALYEYSVLDNYNVSIEALFIYSSYVCDNFTARRYAGSVYAVALCTPVSASVSVTSRSSIKTAERIELVFAMGLLSTKSALCYKEIRVSSK